METEGINTQGAPHKDSKVALRSELSMEENSQQQQIISPNQSAEATELKAAEKQCAKSMNGVNKTPLFYVERSELCRWNDGEDKDVHFPRD